MTHTVRLIRLATLAALSASLLLSACQPDGGESQAEASGMQDMPGMDMPGMDTAASTTDDGMMNRMQAHIRMLDGAGADSLMSMMPMHRQMGANMIAQMNREMRDMQMQTDAAWDATVDSLRRDLVRLPELPAGELPSLMPAHRDRVMRLLEMHRSMMDDMKDMR